MIYPGILGNLSMRSLQPKSLLSFVSTVTGILLFCLVFCLPSNHAAAVCTKDAVFNAMPTTKELTGMGVPINEGLRSDNGPSIGQNNTTTFSRMWMGGSKSRGLSIRLTVYPDSKLAGASVQKYGENLLKSSQGQKVNIGDLGFKTNDQMRPYYMIQKKCMVFTYTTYHPKRYAIENQDAIVNFIMSKLTVLSCCGNTAPVPPPQNNCPVIKSCTITPGSPKPGDKITLACTAVDPDGDNLFYNWTIYDFSKKPILSLSGKTAVWQPGSKGNYKISLMVKDRPDKTGCFDFKEKSVVVLEDPGLVNQPPVIRLSVSPAPGTTDKPVNITAEVKDPDGDAVRGGWGRNGKGGGPDSYPRLQKKPGTQSPKQPIKTRSSNTFVWQGYVTAGTHKMTFFAEDARGAKASRTVSFAVTDPQAPLSVSLLKTPAQYTVPQGPVNFQAVDNAPKGTKLTYEWTIDGKKERAWQQMNPSWSNPGPGQHSVTVRIWKRTGETASASITFLMKPPPPQVPPAGPINTPPIAKIIQLTPKAVAGKPVRLKVVITDPDKKDTHTVKWTIENRNAGNSKQISWTPGYPDNFLVSVLVSDGKDTVRASHLLRVGRSGPSGPGTPKPVPSVVKRSGLFHSNVIFGTDPSSAFEAGELIILRLMVLGRQQEHQLTVKWIDPSGKIIQETPIRLLTKDFTNARSLEDGFSTHLRYPGGKWTVEIFVDGTIDSRLNFSLKNPGTGGPVKALRPTPSPAPRPGKNGGWDKVL